MMRRSAPPMPRSGWMKMMFRFLLDLKSEEVGVDEVIVVVVVVVVETSVLRMVVREDSMGSYQGPFVSLDGKRPTRFSNL
jgi:hypothetical protein